MTKTKLPSFKRPPVIETVLGVQFAPLRALTNAQLGAFWAGIQEGWPIAKHASAIPPVYEHFGGEQSWSLFGSHFSISQDPSCRLRFQNQDKTQMIQIQNGRLHFNWISTENASYPRYTLVKERFDTVYQSFLDFVSANNLGDLKPNQWEVTYVNHIRQGTVWNDLSDVSKLFRGLFSVTPKMRMATIESIEGEWHYEIPPQRGRLHVEIKHGKPSEKDDKEIIRMQLTARGPLSDSLSFGDGLDLGHETIVLSFVDLTSQEAHNYWEPSNDDG